jgi:PKD repeat protein
MKFDDFKVTVGQAPAPNAAPVAAFTSTVSDLTASVNGSTSTDSDGSIASYTWDFGDGGAGTGATASHSYAAAGTYTVTLTVVDNAGATNSVSHPVPVTAPPGSVPPGTVLAQDAFGRTSASGLGTADTGGAWSLNGSAAYFSVDGSAGAINLGAAGLGPSAYLGSVLSSSTDTKVTVSQTALANGGGSIVGLIGRRVGTAGEYRAKVKISATGALTLQGTRVAAGVETTLQSVGVPGVTYAAGQQLNIRLQVTGTAPTTIRAKVWVAGTAEPAAWQVSTTDATAALQAAGSVGILAYLSGTSTNFPVGTRFDDLTTTSV